MSEKLKACPFCGYPAIFSGRIDKQGTLEICCLHCGAMIRELDHKQLIDEWNRRAQPDNSPLTLEQLRQMDGNPIWISPETFNGFYIIADVKTSADKLYSFSRSSYSYYPYSDYGKTWLAYAHKPEPPKQEEGEKV